MTPDEGDLQLVQGAEPVARTQWQLFRRRFFRHKLAMFGLLILVILCVCCFGARWIAPYKNTPDLLAEPAGPSAKHLMGVDLVGKDFLSANLYAGQISLKIGLFGLVSVPTVPSASNVPRTGRLSFENVKEMRAVRLVPTVPSHDPPNR